MLNTYKYLSEALEALSPSVLQKVKKDNIGNQMIMMHHSVSNNTHMSLAVSLCSNSNHLISFIPLNCLKF